MSKRMALLTAALVLAIVWVGFSYVQSLRPAGSEVLPSAVQAGKTVEDFALKDENGKTVRLTDYKGRIVALVFYASW